MPQLLAYLDCSRSDVHLLIQRTDDDGRKISYLKERQSLLLYIYKIRFHYFVNIFYIYQEELPCFSHLAPFLKLLMYKLLSVLMYE